MKSRNVRTLVDWSVGQSQTDGDVIILGMKLRCFDLFEKARCVCVAIGLPWKKTIDDDDHDGVTED